jgi:cell division septum initiation protein DivIVA
MAGRLEHARFTTAFRGFEPREVHDLLAEVAELLRRAAATGAGGPPPPPEGTVEVAGSRNLAVARARHEAAEIVQSARDEAERVRADAEADAGSIRDEARAAFLKGIRDANALVQRARDQPKD